MKRGSAPVMVLRMDASEGGGRWWWWTRQATTYLRGVLPQPHARDSKKKGQGSSGLKGTGACVQHWTDEARPSFY